MTKHLFRITLFVLALLWSGSTYATPEYEVLDKTLTGEIEVDIFIDSTGSMNCSNRQYATTISITLEKGLPYTAYYTSRRDRGKSVSFNTPGTLCFELVDEQISPETLQVLNSSSFEVDALELSQNLIDDFRSANISEHLLRPPYTGGQIFTWSRGKPSMRFLQGCCKSDHSCHSQIRWEQDCPSNSYSAGKGSNCSKCGIGTGMSHEVKKAGCCLRGGCLNLPPLECSIKAGRVMHNSFQCQGPLDERCKKVTGACHHGSYCVDKLTEAECLEKNGHEKVFKEGAVCPLPEAACCTDDGRCNETYKNKCLEIGGVYLDQVRSCHKADLCKAYKKDKIKKGGCCDGGEFCKETTEKECSGFQGTFFSSGCPKSCLGACMSTQFGCLDNSTQAACQGVFKGIGSSCPRKGACYRECPFGNETVCIESTEEACPPSVGRYKAGVACDYDGGNNFVPYCTNACDKFVGTWAWGAMKILAIGTNKRAAVYSLSPPRLLQSGTVQCLTDTLGNPQLTIQWNDNTRSPAMILSTRETHQGITPGTLMCHKENHSRCFDQARLDDRLMEQLSAIASGKKKKPEDSIAQAAMQCSQHQGSQASQHAKIYGVVSVSRYYVINNLFCGKERDAFYLRQGNMIKKYHCSPEFKDCKFAKGYHARIEDGKKVDEGMRYPITWLRGTEESSGGHILYILPGPLK